MIFSMLFVDRKTLYQNEINFGKKGKSSSALRIQLSERGARNLINKWQQTGSVADLKSPRRGQFRIKITEGDLHRINRAVSYYRELTA